MKLYKTEGFFVDILVIFKFALLKEAKKGNLGKWKTYR